MSVVNVATDEDVVSPRDTIGPHHTHTRERLSVLTKKANIKIWN